MNPTNDGGETSNKEDKNYPLNSCSLKVHTNDSQNEFEIAQEAAQYLITRISIKPKVGLICGSGLGSIADIITDPQIFSYDEIPHFPTSTVKGHAGQLVFGYLENVPIMCMRGRFHYYEGHSLSTCVIPIRVMKLMGVTHLIATHAAGAINPEYKVGDIMLIKDHLNLMGIAGNNPLLGLNDDRFGPRFPSSHNIYDQDLLMHAEEIGKELKISDIIRKGVLTISGGPNYESVAEVKFFRMIGVDAVGMSIVHEALTAHHSNMKVFAFSLITNLCVSDYNNSSDAASHEEVIDVAVTREAIVQKLVRRMFQRLESLI